MKKYNISGMSCAACAARVENAVSSLEDVSSCSVNLLTASMTVEGGDEERIISAVIAAGYGISSADNEGTSPIPDIKGEIKALGVRLASSLILLLLLMYVSMGHMMWGFPLPEAIAESAVTIAVIQLVLSGIILIINRRFFISGTRAVFNRAPNMDTLVALGSFVSFAWSVYVLFLMIFDGGTSPHVYLHELYFESAAMIVTLITLGKLLEALAKGKTTSAIKSLLELTPKEAHVIRDGREVTIPSSEVVIDDILVVRPGESFPVDAVVIFGSSSASEASLTGESIPVDKCEGSSVYAATVNLTGFLKCRAVAVGENTVMGEVVKTVSDASATKAPIAKLADKVAGVFVPSVLGIAFLTTVIWLFVRGDIGFALARGISVLVISCPCALGLATPVAIMVGSGIGAKGGVLFKTATSIELVGKARIIALDKTGTITGGEASVTDVYPIDIKESELISIAASLENKSEHPLAKAIVAYGNTVGAAIQDVDGFEALVGSGVRAEMNGSEIIGGSYKFISDTVTLSPHITKLYEKLSGEGKTPLFFTRGGTLIGVIALADTIREDSAEAIRALHTMGLSTVMLTGDNERTARAIAGSVGIDEVRAGILPAGKADAVKSLSADGVVIMVGDGINDAPALTAADVGIAIGGGTDIAIESADVVLMRNGLMGVVGAVRLGRQTLKTIKENLFWAFFYNAICIPVAAGVFVSLGFTLNPMLGALAMSLSSFTVVMNALRLNLKRIFPGKFNTVPYVNSKSTVLTEETADFEAATFEDRVNTEEAEKTEITEKEENIMINLSVHGMMCHHCEARVRSVLEAIDGVSSADVSHEGKYAKVSLTKEIDPEILIKAVLDAGYTCELA